MKLVLFLTISLAFPIEAAKPVPGYGSQPIHFEPSANTSFDYIARTGRYTLQVNSRQAQFQTVQGHTISMHFAGARHTTPSSPHKLPGVSHYYLGSESAQWRTNVPHFSRVRWPQVYPGIDVVYYSNNREIEFDFEIAPGSDAGNIQLRFEGAQQLRINQEGALELTTPTGVLLKRPPIAYQLTRSGRRRNIPVRYALHNNEVTFKLAAYDKSRPLTIDPSVAYATYLGGDGTDTPTGLAVDINGSAYLTGTTTSTAFTGAGLKPTAGLMGFVTKLTPAGNGIVYSLYFNAIPGAIVVDNNGAVYLTGETSGNLPVKDAFQPQIAGLTDAFIAKFQPNGTLAFATYFGGSAEEHAYSSNGIRIDNVGAIYIAGVTQSTDLPVKNAFQPALGGGRDVFVAKLDHAGSSLLFSTYLGGADDEWLTAFDLAPQYSPVVVGRTYSNNYPVTPHAAQSAYAGASDGFVTRLTGSGSQLVYSSYYGSGIFDSMEGVAAEPDGALVVIVNGYTCKTNFNCVLRLENNQATTLYRSKGTYLSGVRLDSFGNLVIHGGISQDESVSIDPSEMVNSIRYRPSASDSYLLLLSPAGRVLFATFWGAVDVLNPVPYFQLPVGAVSDSSGGLYLAGYTRSTGVFTTASAPQPESAGGVEAFLAKFAPGALQQITSVVIVSDVPVTVDGKVYTGTHPFQWIAGSSHRIEAPSMYQLPNARYTFREWRHGGTAAQTIVVGSHDITYRTEYSLEVKLEVAPPPPGIGRVTVTPASADGFYPYLSRVRLQAIANAGYRFTRWSGEISIDQADYEILVRLPLSRSPFRIVANFEPLSASAPDHTFVPVTPCRILDTRPEYGFPTPFGAPALATGVREIPIPQSGCGIPHGAGAYALNITAVPIEPLGYLTVFPAGQPVTGTSTLNATDGSITSNGAIVQAGKDGAISLYSTNRTHVIVDIAGYFTQTPQTKLYSVFNTLCRILDTRSGTPLAPRVVRTVASSCLSDPQKGAAWVVVTAYPRGPLGWLSLNSTSPPSTSILNSPRGEVRTTSTIIPVNGPFTIQASDTTDVTVDVIMDFVRSPARDRFAPISPCRALDTRAADGPILAARQVRYADFRGRCGIPPTATGLVLNVTLLPAAPITMFQLYGLIYQGFRPSASPGPVALATTTELSGGHVPMYADADTHVVLDVLGYFTP